MTTPMRGRSIMTKKQFRHAFLRGNGSALLELQMCENPQKYQDIIHYGCLHNTTYDMQCNGYRGWYLHQAVCLVNSESIIQAIIERYSRSYSDLWLFSQHTAFLRFFCHL
jgi:hypothetical protein